MVKYCTWNIFCYFTMSLHFVNVNNDFVFSGVLTPLPGHNLLFTVLNESKRFAHFKIIRYLHSVRSSHGRFLLLNRYCFSGNIKLINFNDFVLPVRVWILSDNGFVGLIHFRIYFILCRSFFVRHVLCNVTGYFTNKFNLWKFSLFSLCFKYTVYLEHIVIKSTSRFDENYFLQYATMYANNGHH